MRAWLRAFVPVPRAGWLVSLVLIACRDPAPTPSLAPIVVRAPARSAPSDAALTTCATTPAPLARGLVHEQWPLLATPVAGSPPCVDVVRADPAHHRLRALLSAGDPPHTAVEWRDIFHLTAVTNAGMFHDDGAPVGLIVIDGTAHGRDNAKMSGYLAWDPRSPADLPFAIAGRDCDGFDLDELRLRYRSVIQSYRLLQCDGAAIAWKDPKHYSAAGIGLDRSGRLIFLHARAAVTMAELSTTLATHDLAGALFLEGGPEASLVATELARVGSYETNFVEHDDNRDFWKLPNILGLEAR